MGWVMTFLISWRGGRKFFVGFLVLKSGFYVPNHVFLNDLVWVWALLTWLSNFKRKWVMKLRIMHDISCAHQIQNFLKQGVLSPCNLHQGASSLDPCEHLAHRVSFLQFKIEWRPCISGTQRGRGCGVGAAAIPPIFWWQSGEMSHSGEFTIVTVEAWNLWWKWYKLRIYYKVMCTLGGNRFSLTFKVLKPTSFWGLCTLDPRQGRPPDPTRGPKELLKLLNKSR